VVAGDDRGVLRRIPLVLRDRFWPDFDTGPVNSDVGLSCLHDDHSLGSVILPKLSKTIRRPDIKVRRESFEQSSDNSGITFERNGVEARIPDESITSRKT